MTDLTPEELRAITYTVLGEAAGEGNAGMAAVTHVILNRSRDPRFPDSPSEVALEHNSRNVYQFSTWNTKRLGGNDPVTRYPVTSPTYKRAELVVKAVMAGAVPDYTYGATHYWSPSGTGGYDPYWANGEATSFGRVKIGGHVYLARKAVTPIDAPTAASWAAAMSPKFVQTPLPRPRPQIVTDVPLPRADVRLQAAVNRLPDPNSIPPKAANQNDVVARSMQAVQQPSTQSPLQLAVERKAAELRAATARAPKPAAAGIPLQRGEQDAQRRQQVLQAAVNKEASRIALQMAVDRKAQQMAPTKAVERKVAEIAAQPRVPTRTSNVEQQRREQQQTRQPTPVAQPSAPPVSNGKSSSANIVTAKAEKDIERAGQRLQTAVNKLAGVKAAEIASKPPTGGSAAANITTQRAEQQSLKPKIGRVEDPRIIEGGAVVKTQPPPAASYTTPKYGPNPVAKTEERLMPDAPRGSALVDGVGAMPQFGDLAALRSKVAPMPATRPVAVKVAPKPQSNAQLEAIRLRQQQQRQVIVANQARQAQQVRIVAQQNQQRTVTTAPTYNGQQWRDDIVSKGRDAVRSSGDTSSGNQQEAAERRASGDKWRESQANKR